MFTGIIENLGTVENISDSQLSISAESDFIQRVSEGLSISVNGICLTVAEFGDKSFKIDYIPETKDKTNIGSLKNGDIVNLELPATPETFLSGHVVQGHIDGVGEFKGISQDGNSKVLSIAVPDRLNKYTVYKGSITLNGISLTVIEIKDNILKVGIIPVTWEKTMLKQIKVGDQINIEVDVIAKYVEKLIQK